MNQSLVISSNPEQIPLTIFVSTSTPKPSNENYEHVYSGLNPTISFKPVDEFYVVYLTIITKDLKGRSKAQLSIKTGWN